MNIEQFVKGQDGVFAGRYTLKNLLGKGGMGMVYLASDAMLAGDKVAVKILHPHYGEDDVTTKRFFSEVQLTRKVTHPNVVRTFDIGREGGYLFFTMEYVQGITLKEKCSKNPLSADQTIQVLNEICKGLDAIHKAGIIHRDLKPGNVIITSDGIVKVTDFGVAKGGVSDLTAHDDLVGSALYMSPEVWENAEISAATDVYSLGIVAYFMLTGQLPFLGTSLSEMMKLHLSEMPEEPKKLVSSVPAWLNRLVLAMLSKDPKARPQSAVEIMDAIIEWTKEEEAPSNGSQREADEEFSLDEMMSTLVEEVEDMVLSGDQVLNKGKRRRSKIISSFASLKQKFGRPSWKTLLKCSRFFLVLAAVYGIGRGFSGSSGDLVLLKWANLHEMQGTVEIVEAVFFPLLMYSFLFALPLFGIYFMKESIFRSLWGWLQMALGCLVLTVLLFEGNCFRVGKESLNGEKGANRESLQWIAEASFRNILEASLIMPRGSYFRPREEGDKSLDDSEKIDSILNYKGGDPLSTFNSNKSFGQDETELVLVEDYTDAVVANWPYYLTQFGYLFLAFLLALCQIVKRKLGSKSFLLSCCGAAGLICVQVLELKLEGFAVDLFGWSILEENVLRVGPFYHLIDNYSLFCGLLNWGFFAILLFFVLPRNCSK